MARQCGGSGEQLLIEVEVAVVALVVIVVVGAHLGRLLLSLSFAQNIEHRRPATGEQASRRRRWLMVGK